MFYSLMQAVTDGPPKPNMLAQFFPFILMFAILYLLIIRPQRKKQKELQAMLGNLKINDVVITNGGIIGKIVNIKKEKNIIVLRVDETTKIEFQKNAIVGFVPQEEKKA
ncbi:MAG: preprotein translocase subunit YajC [Candidatus Cloacimonadales bacterium]|nr:preprotein translocase subunit YajC [Candidatus Cloacimonadales bacterium]